MKKFLLILTILLGVFLGGCGNSKSDEKVIKIGGNAEYKPYEYLEGNKVTGFPLMSSLKSLKI